MTDVAATLAEMLAELRARCPTMHPAVLPLGYDDAYEGTALLELCTSPAQRDSLAGLLLRARASRPVCALSAQQTTPDDLRFVAFWDMLPERATLQLRRCTFVCSRVAKLLDPLLLLEHFSRPGSSTEEISSLASLFCSSNGRPELSERPARALEWLQECVSLAHACRVVSSGFRSWRVLGPEGKPLRGAADDQQSAVLELVESMLVAEGFLAPKQAKRRCSTSGSVTSTASKKRATTPPSKRADKKRGTR